MTKRRVESDIDALSTDLLTDLSPAYRHALLLEIQRDGHDRQRRRLLRSTPTETYRMPESEYRDRVLSSALWSRRALYHLDTRLLEFERLYSENTARALKEIYLHEEDDPESVSNADDDVSPAELLGELYITYHGYRRFAEEVIEVDFETWFAFEPNGEGVIEAVQEALEANPDFLELAGDMLPAISCDAVDLSRDDQPDELPPDSLDRLVLVYYQELADGFDELSLTAPSPEEDRSRRRR